MTDIDPGGLTNEPELNVPQEDDSSQADAVSEASNSSSQGKIEKVTVFLKATGNAPILKTRKWFVEPDKTISSVNSFVRKCLKLQSTESLFFYVNQSFAPAPDQTMKNLYDCFGVDGKLVLHYCLSQAWG